MAMMKLKHKVVSRSTLLTVVCLYVLLSDAANYVNCTKQKRQLFREQVLPDKGGKIPDSAFQPDRLVLNRINQQGISIPDGINLDQRRQEKHPFPKQPYPESEILNVVLMNDGRYVVPAGRYHFDKPPTIKTTYLIRIPHKTFYKGTSLPQWNNNNAVKIRPMQYYKHIDVTKWEPPTWYNEISNSMLKNNNKHNQDITDPSQQKRQLFREQVLPDKEGKIPDSTFQPDRLVLHRINQQEISIPDGINLDQRRQEKHPFPKQPYPESEILNVVLMNDGRYVVPAGRYHFDKPPTIKTTYLIRIPHKTFYKGTLLPQWNDNNAVKIRPMQYYKHIDVTKWEPPTWYNEISNSMLKNNNKHNQDITDPSQILAEHSSFFQKIHKDFDN